MKDWLDVEGIEMNIADEGHDEQRQNPFLGVYSLAEVAEGTCENREANCDEARSQSLKARRAWKDSPLGFLLQTSKQQPNDLASNATSNH